MACDCHHLVWKLVVVFPLVFEPETATGGETVTLAVPGVALAAVFELLCVLEVPPLTDGAMLLCVLEAPPLTDGAMVNVGWMVIAGCTLIIAMAEARWPPPRPRRPWLIRPWA